MRQVLLAFILAGLCSLLLSGCGESDQVSAIPEFSQAEIYPAGRATVKRLNTRSYMAVGNHLKISEQLDFWSGLTFFQDPWVIAPSSTQDRDGLGPLFNTRSCFTCHIQGGRGDEAVEGVSKPSALLIRLGPNSPQGQLSADPNYGEQVQVRAIDFNHSTLSEKVKPEAKVKLEYQTLAGQFADGEVYQLRQPVFSLSELSYGELADGIALSPRYSPNIYGMGLLDAIAEADLLALEDINDTDQNGISAKYNRVVDHINNNPTALGRFGFKAKQPSLEQQVAAAFIGDLGITNKYFPEDNCQVNQLACQQAVDISGHKNQVEIADKLFELTLEFSKHLGVPPARALNTQQSQQGRQLFYRLNCHACHQPSYTTASDYPDQRLAGIQIWPYSDLALHDMGEGLADDVHEFLATGREWRTAPLWGIGLQQKILGKTRYLHDGRARDINEAILWHGGEAKASQQAYKNLTKSQRQALITFIEAI